MNRTIRNYLLAGLLVAACSTACTARLSTEHLHLFKFGRDPHLLVFNPGNAGHSSFGGNHTAKYGQELIGNGNVIELAHPDYTSHATDETTEPGRLPRYYQQLRDAVNGSAYYGIVSDLRITTALLQELEKHETFPRKFVQQLAAALAPSGTPFLVSLDVQDAQSASCAALVSALRETLPGMLVGRVVRQRNALSERDWDFYIVSSEVLPEEHGRQSALAWLRSRLPTKPVILWSEHPQLHDAIMWTCTGAAGLQYAELPSEKALNNIAWRNHRATAALVATLRAGSVQLMPELAQGQVQGAFGSPGNAVFLMLKPGAETSATLPAVSPGRPIAEPRWYNPWTDENLVLPWLTTTTHVRTLRSPSNDYWLYCERYGPSSAEGSTTITQILPEPPEPDY